MALTDSDTTSSAIARAVGSAVTSSWIFPPGAKGVSWGQPFGHNGHPGIDFPAPEGTPVLAPQPGRYTRSDGGGYGNSVLVTTDAGFWRFAHFSRHAQVADGTVVPAGAVIGYVGTTGNSTGNHLHVEWHPGGGAPVDPAGILKMLEAGGSAPISAPGLGATAGAAGSATLAGFGGIPDLSGLGAFFGKLVDPHTWVRVSLIFGGALLIGAGLVVTKADLIGAAVGKVADTSSTVARGSDFAKGAQLAKGLV